MDVHVGAEVCVLGGGGVQATVCQQTTSVIVNADSSCHRMIRIPSYPNKPPRTNDTHQATPLPSATTGK
jgi:hypothetical protein